LRRKEEEGEEEKKLLPPNSIDRLTTPLLFLLPHSYSYCYYYYYYHYYYYHPQDQITSLSEENNRLIAERPGNYLLMKGYMKRVGADIKYHVELMQTSKACTIS